MGIREELAERSGNDEMLFADGYDDALIGYTDGGVAVYSIESIIRIMITQEEMTEEDALDHFYYNVSGAYVGEYTPIFVHDVEWGVWLIKRCSKCKKYKFKWKYNKNRRKKDGLQHQCRPCQHEYHNKKWYPKNKDKRVKAVKDYKWRKREENYRRVVKEYFVKGCVDCGENNVRVLEFDHVRGRKRKKLNDKKMQ